MKMQINVETIVKELNRLTVTQLRERYAEVFGEASKSFNKQYLLKRVVWRIQALQEGDLSERARSRARELANDADLRIRAPALQVHSLPLAQTVEAAFRPSADSRLPVPGTLLRREYKGKTLLVRVMPKGFEYEGEVYRSLSAVAHKITGAHWNGFHFFGLQKAKETSS